MGHEQYTAYDSPLLGHATQERVADTNTTTQMGREPYMAYSSPDPSLGHANQERGFDTVQMGREPYMSPDPSLGHGNQERGFDTAQMGREQYMAYSSPDPSLGHGTQGSVYDTNFTPQMGHEQYRAYSTPEPLLRRGTQDKVFDPDPLLRHGTQERVFDPLLRRGTQESGFDTNNKAQMGREQYMAYSSPDPLLRRGTQDKVFDPDPLLRHGTHERIFDPLPRRGTQERAFYTNSTGQMGREQYMAYESPLLGHSTEGSSFKDASAVPPSKRPAETKMGRYLYSSWVPVTQAVLSIILCVVLLYVVDGMVVSPSVERKNLWNIDRGLYASDITTIVSAYLVVIRLVGGGWAMTLVWRCAVLLLQGEGLTLHSLNKMTTFRIPVTLKGTHALPIAIALVLMLPSLLISPLLSGAVGWTSILRNDNSTTVRGGFGTRTEEDGSRYYGEYITPRQELLFFATGNAGSAWADGSTSSNLTAAEDFRYIAKDQAPVGSMVENVPIPFIDIHSITWDVEGHWEPWVVNFTNYPGWLDHTKTLPATTYITGNSAIYKNSTSTKFSLQKSTSPDLYNGSWKVSVLTSRADPAYNGTACWGTTRSTWDVLPSGLKILPSFDKSSCYAIGTVNFTTGIRYFDRGIYVTNRTIRGLPDSHGWDKVESDPWSETILQLTTPLMQILPLTEMRIEQMPRLNLTEYVETLIRRSYITLRAASFIYSPETEDLKCVTPSTYLKASVSEIRVILWLGLNFLLPVAALIVSLLERHTHTTHRNPIFDTSAALLFTDVRNVLVDDSQGLSNMSYMTLQDRKKTGKLRLGLIRLEDGKEIYGLTKVAPGKA